MRTNANIDLAMFLHIARIRLGASCVHAFQDTRVMDCIVKVSSIIINSIYKYLRMKNIP